MLFFLLKSETRKKRSSSLSSNGQVATVSGTMSTISVKKPPPLVLKQHFSNKAYDEFMPNAYDDDDYTDNHMYFQLNQQNHRDDHFSTINVTSDRSTTNQATNSYGVGRVRVIFNFQSFKLYGFY